MQTIRELAKFNKVLFIDKHHKYIDKETGEMYTSVTTVKKKFETKFRRKYWITYKALRKAGFKAVPDTADFVPNGKIKVNKKNYTPENAQKTFNLNGIIKDLSDEWDYKRDSGLCIGSIVHDYLENKWFNKVFQVVNPCWNKLNEDKEFVQKVTNYINSADKFLKDFSYLIPIRAEVVVYDEEKKYAGQIDMLVYNPLTESIWLLDYKTDDKIEISNKYEKLLGPLSHLDSCNFNTYSVQTNMYKRILEKGSDIKVDKVMIVSIGEKNYTMVEAKDLSKEINKIWQAQ